MERQNGALARLDSHRPLERLCSQLQSCTHSSQVKVFDQLSRGNLRPFEMDLSVAERCTGRPDQLMTGILSHLGNEFPDYGLVATQATMQITQNWHLTKPQKA